MSITTRIERLEQRLYERDRSGLDAETLQEMLRMAVMDGVAVELCRSAAVLENTNGLFLHREGPFRMNSEAIDIIERLGIPKMLATEEGRCEATRLMRAEAETRFERGIVERYGAAALAKLYAFWNRPLK